MGQMVVYYMCKVGIQIGVQNEHNFYLLIIMKHNAETNAVYFNHLSLNASHYTLTHSHRALPYSQSFDTEGDSFSFSILFIHIENGSMCL